MPTWKIEHNDVISWAKSHSGPPAHAMICDPPYHLVSTVQRFGAPNSKPPKGDVYRRASAGMMGQRWDGLGESGKGIAFDPATWAALAQHLYPGAFGMAFASSRGWHRLACAIEDAGMIIQPSIFNWVTLQSFPKATRIRGGGDTWEGHRYGGQALKNAVEPIIVFQKPYSGRPVDSIVKTGAGALNIDGGRIGTDTSRGDRYNGKSPKGGTGYGGYEQMEKWEATPGRWPSNFLLQCGCDPNRLDPAHHDSCPVRLFDEQAGESVSKAAPRGGTSPNPMSWREQRADDEKMFGYNDSGPASRMFYQSSWQYEVAEALAGAEPVRYEPKVSGAEREAGLDGLPGKKRDESRNASQPSMNGGEGNPYNRGVVPVRNNHPTLKPISLLIYLSKLLAPPDTYAPRRLLIPFSGSGSEICGAVLSGKWESITGIEMSESYCKIAEARCKFWESMAEKVRVYGLDSILQKYGKKEEVPEGQLSLF